MGASTIEWTDYTFNIVWGCQRVSEACKVCYAATMAERFGQPGLWGPAKTTPRRVMSAAYWRGPLVWNERARAAGLRARVFCCSMADVFEDHPMVATEREKLWPLIAETPWLDWQLLTKRPENIRAMLPPAWRASVPNNVWLGCSVETQRRANDRIDALLAVAAPVHWPSCEPLYTALDLRPWLHDLEWIITGGESGPRAPLLELSHVRGVRDQCDGAGVAYFHKEMGTAWARSHGLRGKGQSKGEDMRHWPLDLRRRAMPRSRVA